MPNLTFDFESILNEPVKISETIINFKKDWLACSYAIYRTKSTTTLTDNNIFKDVIEQDHDMAKKIRDYYTNRLIIKTLKGQELSSFSLALKEVLLNTDHNSLPLRYSGLVYRLPEYYHNDQELTSIVEQHSFKNRTLAERFNDVHDVLPIKRLIINNKNKKSFNYWGKIIKTNSPIMFESIQSNEALMLDQLWVDAINNQKFLTIKISAAKRHHSFDFDYYHSDKFLIQNIKIS